MKTPKATEVAGPSRTQTRRHDNPAQLAAAPGARVSSSHPGLGAPSPAPSHLLHRAHRQPPRGTNCCWCRRVFPRPFASCQSSFRHHLLTGASSTHPFEHTSRKSSYFCVCFLLPTPSPQTARPTRTRPVPLCYTPFWSSEQHLRYKGTKTIVLNESTQVF